MGRESMYHASARWEIPAKRATNRWCMWCSNMPVAAPLSVSPLTECTLSSTCFGPYSFSGQPVRRMDIPHGETASPCTQKGTTFTSTYTHCLSSSHCEPLWRTWLHCRGRVSSPDVAGAAVRSHWDKLLPRLSRPGSLSLFSQSKCFSPDHTGGPLPIFWYLPNTGPPRNGHSILDVVCWVLCRRSSDFPWSTGCIPAHAVQGAAGLLCCLSTERAKRMVLTFLTLKLGPDFIPLDLTGVFGLVWIAFSLSSWALSPIMSWGEEQQKGCRKQFLK